MKKNKSSFNNEILTFLLYIFWIFLLFAGSIFLCTLLSLNIRNNHNDEIEGYIEDQIFEKSILTLKVFAEAFEMNLNNTKTKLDAFSNIFEAIYESNRMIWDTTVGGEFPLQGNASKITSILDQDQEEEEESNSETYKWYYAPIDSEIDSKKSLKKREALSILNHYSRNILYDKTVTKISRFNIIFEGFVATYPSKCSYGIDGYLILIYSYIKELQTNFDLQDLFNLHDNVMDLEFDGEILIYTPEGKENLDKKGPFVRFVKRMNLSEKAFATLEIQKEDLQEIFDEMNNSTKKLETYLISESKKFFNKETPLVNLTDWIDLKKEKTKRTSDNNILLSTPLQHRAYFNETVYLLMKIPSDEVFEALPIIKSRIADTQSSLINWIAISLCLIFLLFIIPFCGWVVVVLFNYIAKINEFAEILKVTLNCEEQTSTFNKLKALEENPILGMAGLIKKFCEILGTMGHQEPFINYCLFIQENEITFCKVNEITQLQKNEKNNTDQEVEEDLLVLK